MNRHVIDPRGADTGVIDADGDDRAGLGHFEWQDHAHPAVRALANHEHAWVAYELCGGIRLDGVARHADGHVLIVHSRISAVLERRLKVLIDAHVAAAQILSRLQGLRVDREGPSGKVLVGLAEAQTGLSGPERTGFLRSERLRLPLDLVEC